jgi:esterase/lipase superfamily enzyme/TRAP-type C4-dicarboxylate transport system substrate-binding protein
MLRALVTIVALISTCVTYVAADPIVARITIPGPQILPGIEQFLSAVNRQAADLVRIEQVPPRGDILSSVRTGEVDLAAVPSLSFAATDTQRFSLFHVPFAFDDPGDVIKLQRTAVGDALLASIASDGLVGLGYWNQGMTHLFGPLIQEAEQFEGVRIRTTPSRVTQELIRGLGAFPIPLPFNELAAALRDQKVQAFYASPFAAAPMIAANKELSRERVKAVMRDGFIPQLYIVVASEAAWIKWPFRLQSVLSSQIAEVAARLDADVSRRDEEGLSQLKELGLDLHVLSDAQLERFRNVTESAFARAETFQKDPLVPIALRAVKQTRRQTQPRGPAPPQRRAEPAPQQPQRTDVTPADLPIFFATDRKKEPDPDSNYQFGAARGTLIYGTARLNPTSRDSMVQGDNDEARLQRIDLFPSDQAFRAALTARMKNTNETDILIYVHGFNNTFLSAVQGAASIASGIKFGGPVVVFSWPSDGVALRYNADENQIQLSRDPFATFLSTLQSAIDPDHIDLLTHSMGGRLVGSALEWMMVQPSAKRPLMHQLIFAAPDVDSTLFGRLIPSFVQSADRVTLYASGLDQALLCSKLIHDGPRAGLSGRDMVVHRNMDTIDATNVETRSLIEQVANVVPGVDELYYLFFKSCRAGHSYVTRNLSVLSDLNSLVIQNVGPNKRARLEERAINGIPYWAFKIATP